MQAYGWWVGGGEGGGGAWRAAQCISRADREYHKKARRSGPVRGQQRWGCLRCAHWLTWPAKRPERLALCSGTPAGRTENYIDFFFVSV